MVIVPPYPFTLQDPSDVPIAECWYARPQLFFTCNVRPKDGRPPSRANYTHGPDDIRLELVFFSTFESLDLPKDGPMEQAGVQKLYEPSPTPILFVAPCQHVLGRVPLFPLFLDGNATSTIPTSTVSTNGPNFHMEAQIRPTQQPGGGAMCTR